MYPTEVKHLPLPDCRDSRIEAPSARTELHAIVVHRVTLRRRSARNPHRTIREIGLLLSRYEGVDLEVRRLPQ